MFLFWLSNLSMGGGSSGTVYTVFPDPTQGTYERGGPDPTQGRWSR